MGDIENTGSYLAITTTCLPTEDDHDRHKQPEDAASLPTLCCSLTVRQRVGGGGGAGLVHPQCAVNADSFLHFQTRRDAHKSKHGNSIIVSRERA